MIRDEGGQVAGIETLPFGLLVFVVGALLITNIWAVFDVRTTVGAAAREGARAYVEAPSAADAEHAARAAAADAVAAVGRDANKLAVSLHADGDFARCTRVIVEARYPVPFIRLPWIGGLGEATSAVGRHSEIVDPFRSGVPGDASCGAAF